MSRYFIFSKSYFDTSLILYHFNDTTDIETNYSNSLFQIVPSGEYLYKKKLTKLTEKLKSIKWIPELENFDFNEYRDVYTRYKQEVCHNNENYNHFINQRKQIQSGDCIQLIHINSNKFVIFKEDKKNLKNNLRTQLRVLKKIEF